jgi:hypothetical protein
MANAFYIETNEGIILGDAQFLLEMGLAFKRDRGFIRGR